MTNDKQIDSCLEQICGQGCRSVNHVIQQLEQGQVIDAAQHLSAAQQRKLLQELQNIMAVYGNQSCEVR